MSAFEFQITTWQNPTDQDCRFHVMSGDKPIHVHVASRKTVQLPAEFDNAVRTERGGLVIGGLAPQLVPLGREAVPIHESIVKAHEMGILEERLGRRGASFSPEALIALAREKDGRIDAELQRDELQRQLAEVEAKLVAGRAGTAGEPPAREPPAAPAAPSPPPAPAPTAGRGKAGADRP
jgi:hypothetical protein